MGGSHPNIFELLLRNTVLIVTNAETSCIAGSGGVCKIWVVRVVSASYYTTASLTASNQVFGTETTLLQTGLTSMAIV